MNDTTEELRRAGSLLWRLVLAMLGVGDDPAAYAHAQKVVEDIDATEEISAADWRAVSELLALRVADDLTERFGLQQAVFWAQGRVALMLDRDRFQADLDE